MKSYYIIVFLIVSTLVSLKAQDAHFSQFYAAPLLMNPATAGTYTGTFRISTSYRDQWRSAVDNPFRTFVASGDVKFDLNYNRTKMADVVAIGITFFSDRVNTFDYNTNQIMLTGAYHKALDKKTKQYLGIGVQAGILQKSLNYEDLTFEDQFNAINGYTNATGENLPINNKAFADFSLGLYYTISPSKDFNFHVGLGYYHINQPNISFFFTPNNINPNIILLDKLSSKYSVHTGASFKTGDRMSVQPRINALIQGKSTEINLGTTFRYKLSKTEGKYLHIGPYIRGVKNYSNFGLESIIAMVGIEQNNFIIGFSYDQSLKSIANGRTGLSSFEFSVIYIGEHNNEDNFCPQF